MNRNPYEEIIEVFEYPLLSKVFFVDHAAFKDGVNVIAMFGNNQIKLCSSKFC